MIVIDLLWILAWSRKSGPTLREHYGWQEGQRRHYQKIIAMSTRVSEKKVEEQKQIRKA
jgi:hypothetical protein